MKIIYFIAVLIIFFSLSEVQSQTNLYLPRNFTKAYENGTRSFDGKPGPNYFQNKADYKITAEIEPKTKILSGKETIVYHNNSNDTLKRIYFRMYQDLYKATTSRDRAVTEEEITEGIILHSVKINNVESLQILRTETLLSVFPDSPIPPLSTTEISIQWSFRIPNGTSIRMGAKDSTTFMVAYWYPQVSVYDDISGWDDLPYNGNTEFYNDFNNYDVEIKMPYDFNVWATGLLQNPSDVFNSAVLNKYNEAKTSESIINIIDSNNIERKDYYNKKSGFNTWKYKAENVSDFVFGTSNHHLWDATSAEVEPGRRVLVSAAYNKASKDFYQVNKISQDAVLFFSNEFPKIPFPFPSITIFNGQSRGGMEFPMFVNDRSAKTYPEAVDVTTHEIAHQYFPFHMGINEKKYTWMEEGMAQMIPEELQDRLSVTTNKRRSNTSRYERFAGSEMEATLMTTAYLLKGEAFSTNAYFKSAVVYNLLRDYFGREKYIEIMKEYITRWNGKHPTPYDFFFTFNEASGENLEWFWQPWFFDKGYPDLSIQAVSFDKDNPDLSTQVVTESSGKTNIVIKNNGTLPVPVEVTIKYVDGSEKVLTEKMDVWKDGKKQVVLSDDSGKEIDTVTLGNDFIPDVSSKNNLYKK